MTTSFQSDAFQSDSFQIAGGLSGSAVNFTTAGLTVITTVGVPALNADAVRGGDGFGVAYRLRRKKRRKVHHEENHSLWDAVEAAFEEAEQIAAAASAKIEDDAKEAEVAKAASYLAAYEAAAEAASAKIAAEIAALQSRIEAADTAIAKAYAKAEEARQRLEIERHEREISSRLEAARKQAEEAYQRFLELEAANDDDEEAAAALLMILEAMNEQRAA